MQEDQEHRRELSHLKKLDQEENLQRTRNFYVSLVGCYNILTEHVPGEADREDPWEDVPGGLPQEGQGDHPRVL